MFKSLFSYTCALLFLFLLWKGLATVLTSAVLPQPEAALHAFWSALWTETFWSNMGASTYRAGAGMVLAWILGFPLGVYMGGSKRVDTLLSPLVYLTYPIPKIVFLPVVLLILGLGDLSKIAMITLILSFQVLVTTRDGVKHLPATYIDSIRAMGASGTQIIREVYIPAALPAGFTALRINSGVSIAVLFFVESFATSTGLGYMIMDAWGRMDYEGMFAGIFGMSLLGVSLFEAVNLLEKRFCRWKER
jgi:NitT/TauT family transport system permease protein